MLVDARPELHLFDDDHLLFLLGFALLLLLLEDVLTVIHDLADRRVRGRRDLHEIKVLLTGHFLRLRERDDSNLRSIESDEANLRDSSDHVVDSGLRFSGSAVESGSSSRGVNTLLPP